jgi:hypothetical protein
VFFFFSFLLFAAAAAAASLSLYIYRGMLSAFLVFFLFPPNPMWKLFYKKQKGKLFLFLSIGFYKIIFT